MTMAPRLILALFLPVLHAEWLNEKNRFRHCGSFPHLENSTSSVYALVGDDVTIYAERTDRGIQWQVDPLHSEIGLSGVRKSSKTMTDRLILKNITASFNLSKYRYELSSDNFTSAWVTLRIGAAPGISSNDRLKLKVIAGETIPEICLSLTGLPLPDLHLQLSTPERPAVPLSYVLVEGGFCVRTNSTVVSSGLVTVTAENCFGSASLQIRMSVQVKPSVTLHVDQGERLVIGEIGKDIIISCQVGGIPFPDVVWYKDGGILTKQRSLYNSSYLRITDLIVQDSGLYKVVVNNEVGSDMANFTLEVISEDDKDKTSETLSWWLFIVIAVISATIGSGITVVVCAVRRCKRGRNVADKDSITYDTPIEHDHRYASMNLTRSGTASEQGGLIRPYATTRVSTVMAAHTQELYEEPISFPPSISESRLSCQDLTSQGYEPMSPTNGRAMTLSTGSFEDAGVPENSSIKGRIYENLGSE